MSEKNDNINQPSSLASLPDAFLIFECRQAMLRKQHSEPAADVEWDKFQQTIKPAVSQQTVFAQKPSRRRYFAYGIFAGIAAVVLLLLLFRWYGDYLQNRPIQVFVAQERTQAVTIQMGNTEKIISAKGGVSDPLAGAKVDLKKADFSEVCDSKVQMRTIQTSYGKDYRVVLNDGTQVIMNAGSKLTFPTRFTGAERVVTLEGEAYFKVRKNPQVPFLVKTKKMDTRAYGTEFNVKAYKGMEPHVTLIEGVVVVDIADMNKNVKLMPSEDVSFNNKTIAIRDIDPQYYSQWKDGFLYYDNIALGEILSDVGRWYNVNVEVEKSKLMSYRLHFVVNRSAGVDEVVENLNDFKYLKVVKNGNKIIIGEKKIN